MLSENAPGRIIMNAKRHTLNVPHSHIDKFLRMDKIQKNKKFYNY